MRKPLSPEAKAAAIERLNEAMRKACERLERPERDIWQKFWQAVYELPPELRMKVIRTPEEISEIRGQFEAARLAEEMVRLCDEMGPNV